MNKKTNNYLSAIKKIEQASRLVKDSVSFAQGTSSFYSDSLIRQEVERAIKKNKVDGYSEVAGLFKLRKIISKKLVNQKLSYFSEKEIIITAGATQALSATMLALFKRGDHLLLFTPSYPYYFRISEMLGINISSLKLEEKNDWSVPISLLKKSINSKTKGIIICNPNNPTGSVINKAELLIIAKLAEKHSLKIILDDAYYNFYFGEDSLFSLCQKNFFKGEVIRIVSLSKTFDLSGWRIAFVHGPENLINKIIQVHDNLINCAPVISQYAAIAALKNEKKIVSKNFPHYLRRRELMASYLSELKDYLEFSIPQGSYFFFPKIKNLKNSKTFCFKILKEAKVALVPGEEFGPGGEGHLRICFGKSEKEIIKGMIRFTNYFKKAKHGLN